MLFGSGRRQSRASRSRNRRRRASARRIIRDLRTVFCERGIFSLKKFHEFQAEGCNMNPISRILVVSTVLLAGCTNPETSSLKRDVAAIPNSQRLPLGAAYQTVTGSFLKQSCLGASTEARAIQTLPFPEGSLTAGFGESRAV